MSNLKHINVFDFDDTMFRTQNFASLEPKGKTMYEWYDSERSLSPDFHIPAIENVIEKTRETENPNYLITNRKIANKEQVMRLLSEQGCQFTEVFFCERDGNKADVLSKLLAENPTVKSVTIYEDSISELTKYAAVLSGSKLQVSIFFVDKTKIFELPLSAIEIIRYLGKPERIRLT